MSPVIVEDGGWKIEDGNDSVEDRGWRIAGRTGPRMEDRG
jgi:hypothetical protein